jgi:hypothetical protein
MVLSPWELGEEINGIEFTLSLKINCENSLLQILYRSEGQAGCSDTHPNPSTGEAEAQGSPVQEQPGLHSEFEASPGFTVRPCLKKTQQNKTKPQKAVLQLMFLPLWQKQSQNPFSQAPLPSSKTTVRRSKRTLHASKEARTVPCTDCCGSSQGILREP